MYTKRARTFLDAVYRPKDLNSEFVKTRGPEYQDFLKVRFMPDDASAILHCLEPKAASAMLIDRHDSLMCKLQIVPPPIIRPSNFVGESKVRSENDLTSALQDVVRTNIEFMALLGPEESPEGLGNEARNGEDFQTNYETCYDKLQVMVSGIINYAIKRTAAQQGLLPLVAATSKRKVIDLKIRLNGKKARVRGNLNGKRVDQSGRTVISGDSSHDIDELGVPSVMMNKLTFPETVTTINRAYLAGCIVQGAYKNNGALAVRPPNHSTDNVIWLPMLDLEARIDLASQLRPGWTVERHLINGDWVLFNRQPSLWKASMMAFRCYRVEGLTARLPLPVTRAFNADFDGDEMNIHALQGYEAITEAQELMSVSQQIVTPQSNSIIIGLVQDSLVGAWRLTAQDCFFTREEAIDLLCCLKYKVPGLGSTDSEYRDTGLNLDQNIFFQLQEPAVLRPKALWTGKQLVSHIIPNTVSIIKQTRCLNDLLDPPGLCIKNGQMLAGRLNKSYLGAASTGLVHAIWRLYGPGGSHKFISDAQRLFVKHLQHDGPTQSIIDCLIHSDTSVREILSKHLGRSDSILGLNLPEEIKEAKSSAILQETLRTVGSHVLSSVRQESALANCVNSGSKGNVMNIAQISGCVGQQTIYGRRVPLRPTRLGPRTLIYYSPGDLRAEARGFVSNSYMSGLSPAEFFEHQMAGREGIVATAVNTSESGYNQRRMIKGQESQCVSYDGTVRVSSNIIIQSIYGGDDLDGSRLERIHLPWIFEAKFGANLGAFTTPQSAQLIQRALKHVQRVCIWNAGLYKEKEFLFPCAVALDPIVRQFCEENLIAGGANCGPNGGANGGANILVLYRRVMALHARHHSSKRALMTTSVAVLVLQAAFWIQNHGPLCPASIESLVKHYASALVAPGEGVGALGASSIGEPSMQKTLNTFHYTGIADKNVTITGLPRFKQLINGVDTYETANMTAKLRTFQDTKEALQISKVLLSDLMTHRGPLEYERPHSAFLAYKNLRGPLSVKFSTQEDLNCAGTVTFALSWAKCAQKNILVSSVVRALRETLSYDAFVVAGPHWHGKTGPSIKIYFAPWLMPSALPAICEGLQSQQQVRGIDYVKNCIVFQDKSFGLKGHMAQDSAHHVVETEGSNIVDLAKCAFLDPQSIRSTNVVEMSQVLGIACGLTVLQSELHKVLSFDGSYIDPRHTWLLTDTMGRSGYLAAMNRHHMEDLGSSLLQKASFEQSLDVFEEGAAFGRSDPLAGATERIITGQPVCIGTGLVGIVSEELEAQEEIFVEPLESEPPLDTTFVAVRPLNWKQESDFNPAAYATKFTDMDKIAVVPFLEDCVSKFRISAASRRIFPSLKVTMKLSESRYKEILGKCWAYKLWSTSTSSNLTTEVHWPLESKTFGQTLLTSSETLSSSIDIFFREASENYACEIFYKKPLDPLETPFGVEATRVIMRQQNYFEKGAFALTLARQWTGTTNVETEELLLKTRGQAIAILETIDSESILQNRCSDAQLANAILQRLP